MTDEFQSMLFEQLQFPSQRQVRKVLKSLREVEEVMQRTNFVHRVPERAVQRREVMGHLARTRVAFEKLLAAMVKTNG